VGGGGGRGQAHTRVRACEKACKAEGGGVLPLSHWGVSVSVAVLSKLGLTHSPPSARLKTVLCACIPMHICLLCFLPCEGAWRSTGVCPAGVVVA